MFKLATIFGIVLATLCAVVVVRRSPARDAGLFFRLLGAGCVVCMLVLAVTGVGAVFFTGESLSGYPLLAHVTFGVFLAIGLCVWGGVQWGRSFISSADLPDGSHAHRPLRIKDAVLILLGLFVVATALLGMFPLWEPQQIAVLVQMHRWCSLGLVMVVLGQAGRLV